MGESGWAGRQSPEETPYGARRAGTSIRHNQPPGSHAFTAHPDRTRVPSTHQRRTALFAYSAVVILAVLVGSAGVYEVAAHPIRAETTPAPTPRPLPAVLIPQLATTLNQCPIGFAWSPDSSRIAVA